MLNSVYSEPAVQPVAEQQIVQEQQVTQQTTTSETLEDVPETIPEKNYENLKKIKNSAQTYPLLIVFMTIIFIFILFLVVLSLYRYYRNVKIKGNIISAPPKETLESPKDFNTAITLFLGKTDE